MTVNDPFDLVDADEDDVTPFEEPKPAPKKAAVKKTPTDREGVTVTLKGGAGFDAPWIVIHAADIEDAYEQVSGDNATLLAKLMDRAKSAAQHFSGGQAAAPRPAPQQATDAPSWFPPAPGPGWSYKTAMKKDGSGMYHAWAPPRGSEENWKFHNPPK